jgi:outer membrane lipoprotein-sorting protein
MRLSLPLFLAVGIATAAQAQSQDAGKLLHDLESRLADIKTVQAKFTQEKKLSLFEQTITIDGRLYLENPGRLAWHVDRPVRYAMVVSGATVRQWDEDTRKVQQMSLSGNPVFNVIAEQLRSWFSGRYAALAADYAVNVVSNAPCVLSFTPKPSSVMAQAIRSVTVTMQADARYVSSIRIEDRGGDTTAIRFLNPLLNEPIDPRAWEVEPRE